MAGGRALRIAAALALPALGLLAPAAARAQAVGVSLDIVGAPLAWPAPSPADFDAGFLLLPTPVQFTVDATKGPPRRDLVTTVTIRATSATLGANGRPVSDVQWSLDSPAGPWAPLSIAPVVVRQLTMRRNGINDTWSGALYFRTLLSWTTHGPGTYSTGIDLTLDVIAQ